MNRPSTITREELVSALRTLTKGQPYSYVHDKTQTLTSIEDISKASGPIRIKRWKPAKGETHDTAKEVPISAQMLDRVAQALSPGTPLNIDRQLGASYNTRSALEALLCHTPEFYFCYPGRIDMTYGKVKIKAGHKHIIWLPEEPHALGQLVEMPVKNMEINEIPSKNVVYNALELPTTDLPNGKINSTEQRIHLHMQMAVYEIGCSFGVKTYIAKNDQGTKYKGKLLIEHKGIVQDLSRVPTIGSFDGAASAGNFIDAIWLCEKSIPAVFEVENSTGVTDGLTRMLNFKQCLPPYSDMRFIIIAPDNLREKALREIAKPEFAELKAYYMSYSSVSELLGLCQERHIIGITPAFIETFCE